MPGSVAARCIGALIVFAAMLAGGCESARPKLSQPPVAVPFLMYHHIADLPQNAGQDSRDWTVAPKAFAAQMEWLHKRGYHPVTPHQVGECLRGGPKLPARAVIVSFDDGWIEQYALALPILKREGLTATFFVYPAGIGAGTGDGVYMTWNQLADLVRQGMDIQAHSLDHPDLTMTKPEDARRQIVESKAILEAKLNRPITTLAYPFGKYNDAVIGMVKAAGYRCAAGTDEGILQTPDRMYSMKRTQVRYDDSIEEFARKVTGDMAKAGRRAGSTTGR